MTSDPTNPPVEVEAKFLGGESEFQRILGWLEAHQYSKSIRKPPVNRLHVYFDADGVMYRAGCRLRCVVAAGEWCRYDFKAECGNVHNETVELSINKTTPVLTGSVINEMLERLPDGEPRKILSEIQKTARIVVVMVGRHLKTIARKGDLELEISWDQLTLLDTGGVISEVEVELIHGTKDAFDTIVLDLERTMVLKRVQASKYQQAIAIKAGNQKGNPQ